MILDKIKEYIKEKLKKITTVEKITITQTVQIQNNYFNERTRYLDTNFIKIQTKEDNLKMDKDIYQVFEKNGEPVKANFFCDGCVIEEEGEIKVVNGKALQVTRGEMINSSEVPAELERERKIIVKSPKINLKKIYLTFDYYMGEEEKRPFLDKLSELVGLGHFTSRHRVSVYFAGGKGYKVKKPLKKGFSPIIETIPDKENTKKSIVPCLPSSRLETIYIGHKRSTQENLYFYDKYAETNRRKYKGLLRIELLIKTESMPTIKAYHEGSKTKEELIQFFIDKIDKMIEFKHVRSKKDLNHLSETNKIHDVWKEFLENFQKDCKNAVDLDKVCAEISEAKQEIPDYAFIEPTKALEIEGK